MCKQVAVITFAQSSSKVYRRQLKDLFGDEISVQCFSFEEGPIGEMINADVVVVSTYAVYESTKKFISLGSDVVIINATLPRENLKKIKDLPSGTRAMLVNISPEMALETISLIYHLGINHIELVPVYPGIKEVPDLNLAITPGELKCIPPNVKQVIDIGNRVLDTSTVIEIALRMELEQLVQEERFKDYFDSIATNTFSFEKMADKTNRLESQFDILLRILEEGIIGINVHGYIFAFNDSAENILALKREEILGKKAWDVLPDIPFAQVFQTLKPIEAQLIKINDNYISLNLVPVMSHKIFLGAFAIIVKYKKYEYQQYKLRAQLFNKGHRAKYNFSDIIGRSPAISKTKELSMKMSKVDSSILIIGESGTGKELFAQAIHNCSNRREFPFVAVNCAAIPENLLETELFGYEEGAFTGAKKGGKFGLFEFAHLGTLFLDEIGEMTPHLQTKLLRVIQEKEVMRIGGDRVINVDVRIIAATNQELSELVNKGVFRKDLYYRLNVLPLNIPPLRERKEDILLLINEFKKELNGKFEISQEAGEILLSHSWDGNVRELRNYVEYFTYTGDTEITALDLPFVRKGFPSPAVDDNRRDDDIIEKFKQEVGSELIKYRIALQTLTANYKNRKTTGRRSLIKVFETEGIIQTEQEIRIILRNLEKYHMVKISRGRGGSKVTPLGMEILNKIKMG